MNVCLRFAIEVPSLTMSHGRIIDLLLLLGKPRILKAFLHCVLLKKPCAEDLLLLIAQCEVRALNVDSIFDHRVRACGAVRIRAKTYEEANTIGIVWRKIEECLQATYDLTNEGSDVSFLELSLEIHCGGILEVQINQKWFLTHIFLTLLRCTVTFYNTKRTPLLYKEVLVKEVEKRFIVLVGNRELPLKS